MISEEKLQQIERYLFNQLSESERRTLEADIQTDQETAAAFKLLQLEQAAMRLAHEKELREQMAQWKKERQEQAQTSEAIVRRLPLRKVTFYRLAAAMSILLLAGLFTFRWAENTYSNQAILSELEGTGFADSFYRRGNAPDDLYARAASAILEKQYQNALEAVAAETPESFTGQMIKAEALKGLGDFDAATTTFQNAARLAANAIEREEAEWELAKVYLQANQLTQAKQQLEAIAGNPDHDFQTAAGTTLRKLNSFWRKLMH